MNGYMNEWSNGAPHICMFHIFYLWPSVFALMTFYCLLCLYLPFTNKILFKTNLNYFFLPLAKSFTNFHLPPMPELCFNLDFFSTPLSHLQFRPNWLYFYELNYHFINHNNNHQSKNKVMGKTLYNNNNIGFK